MERANVYIFDDEDKLLHVSDEYVDDESILEEDIDNDSNNLTVVFPYTADACDYIEGENQIVVKDLRGVYRLWTIKEVEDVNGDEGKLKMAICMPSYVELNDAWVYERRPQNMPINDVLDVVLDGTRFERGRTGDYGTQSTSLYYQSVTESLKHIRSVWGGEYIDRVEFDDHGITGRFIDWERKGINNGKRFEIDKDIQSIKRTVLHYPKTALIGRGGSVEVGEGNSRKITFEDVEWNVLNGDPVDKPKGQKYVDDPEALKSYGIKTKEGKIHRIGIYDNDDITNPEELLQVTWENVQHNNKPQVKYEMSVRTFYGISDYEHEQVYLGDTGYIIDDEMRPALTVQSRIIKVSYSIGNPSVGDITVGNFLRIKDDESKLDWVISKVTENSGSWDSGGIIDDDSFPNVKPPTPDNLQATGLFSSIMLKWDYDPSVYIAEYRVYGSTNANFVPSDSDNFLYATKSGGYAHDAEVSEQWYFVVCAVNTYGQRSDFSQRVMAQTKQIDGNTEISEQTITKELLAQQAIIDEVHLNNAIITDAHINGRLSSNVLQIGDGAIYDDGYDPTDYIITKHNMLKDTFDHNQRFNSNDGGNWGDFISSSNHRMIPVEPGQRLTASVYHMNRSNKRSSVMIRLFTDYSASFTTREDLVGNRINANANGWSTISFIVPEGYYFLDVYTVRFDSSSTNEGFVDYSRLKLEESDIRTPWKHFIPAENGQVERVSYNLLPNGTFNEGMKFWGDRFGNKPPSDITGVSVPSSDKPDSSFLVVGPYPTDRSSPYFNTERIPVNAGDIFILKYDIQVKNLSGNYQYISMRTFDNPNDTSTNGTSEGISVRTSGVNGGSFSTSNTDVKLDEWVTMEHIIEINENNKFLAFSFYAHTSATHYWLREVQLHKGMEAPLEFKGHEKEEKGPINLINNGTFNAGKKSWLMTTTPNSGTTVLDPEDDKRNSNILQINTNGVDVESNFSVSNDRRLLKSSIDVASITFDFKLESIPSTDFRIFRFLSYASAEGGSSTGSSFIVNGGATFTNVIMFSDVQRKIANMQANTWYTVSFELSTNSEAENWIETSLIFDGQTNHQYYMREVMLTNSLVPKQFMEDAKTLWAYKNTTYIDGGSIYANSVTANQIQAGTITANSGIIANAAIGNAQIRELDASKLMANTVIANDVIIRGHLDGVTGTFSGKLLSLYVDSGWASPPFSTATEIEYGNINSFRYNRGSFQIGDGDFRLSKYPQGFIDAEYDDEFIRDDIGQTIENLKFRETSVIKYNYEGLILYGNGESSTSNVLSLLTNGKNEISTSNNTLILTAGGTSTSGGIIDIGYSQLLFRGEARLSPRVSASESGGTTNRTWFVLANERTATINGLRTDFRYTEMASRERLKLFTGTDQKSVQGTPVSGSALEIDRYWINFYRTNDDGSEDTSWGRTAIRGNTIDTHTVNSGNYVQNAGNYVYLGSNSGTRVTDTNTYQGSGYVYKPIRAASFPEGSSILYKDNIEDLSLNDAYLIIDSVNPVIYNIKSDLEAGVYNKKKIGAIMEMSPELIRDEDGIDYRSLSNAALRVVQDQRKQLIDINKELENIYLVLEQIIN